MLLSENTTITTQKLDTVGSLGTIKSNGTHLQRLPAGLCHNPCSYRHRVNKIYFFTLANWRVTNKHVLTEFGKH